ncbi:zinc-dependent alcohol dehydrogenase family protein [Dongia sp.]|uniref:zinc-dependent alcohol dehydrogenase family protein n=1 Tax=Dongia sp. TaxID=1977262 RepID=UPI0035AF337E
MPIPSMRALQAPDPASPLRMIELPRPAPGPGQVLVRIKASGVNPLDLKIRAAAAAHARHPLPNILGIDMAGTVEAAGPGVTRFKAGDAVFGMVGGVGGHQGTLAEFAAVDADLLALKPAGLDMRAAAALPLIFITAWEGLVDRAQVKSGERVLVHGGAGGVGHMAVQLAKARGAEIFATEGAERRGLVESQGATFIDRTEDVATYVAAHTGGDGFDVIYDTAGGPTLDASFQAVRPYGGRVVSCLGWGTHALAPLSFRAASYAGVFTLLPLLTGKGRAHHGDILAAAASLADAGQLKPQLDGQHYTLQTADAAHDAINQRRAQGKVVIEIGK